MVVVVISSLVVLKVVAAKAAAAKAASAAAALLPAIPLIKNNLIPIIEASRSMNEKHSRFVEKMRTLRALRDNLLNKTNKHKSSMQEPMDDWFGRVRDIEELADELGMEFSQKFPKEEEETEKLNVFTRARFSKQMDKMCSEICELEADGYRLAAYSGFKENGANATIRTCIVALICSCLIALLVSSLLHRVSLKLNL